MHLMTAVVENLVKPAVLRGLLARDEMLAVMLLILVTGNETTRNLIGNGMLASLRNPGELGRLREDPGLFDDPDTLDIGRGEKSHLAFGRGIHYCLGAALAVLEARVAFASLLDRFPSIRLAAEPRYRDNVVLRGLDELLIEVERA